MASSDTAKFRQILEDDHPAFLDRVDTPWEPVPDLEEYNKHAYDRIRRAVKDLSKAGETKANVSSQGILVLGEAGTGKTHLLMRVAGQLAAKNHILFVRRPNVEGAVALHIWQNIVQSLSRTLNDSLRSQLDDLLAHVVSRVLIAELEPDIRNGKDASQKRRWVKKLQEDPFNLFSMLGDGEARKDNLRRIRNRILRVLRTRHPDIDQNVANALITYCFITREDRKRVLLQWLAGWDVDEAEAKDFGLPPSWVVIDERSSDVSTLQQREDHALRAIRTIGTLSTYYHPLILAFDQLEGLRDQPRLTQDWGNAVREIFSMAPNFLVITCIFPSLWQNWFVPTLDQSVCQRIAQQTVILETFGPQHGLALLATHLRASFDKHRLPTNIYPFTKRDVERLCQKAESPRAFLQAAHAEFHLWLDNAIVAPTEPSASVPNVISQVEIDEVLRSALNGFEAAFRKSYPSEMTMEEDFYGRVRSITETLLRASASSAKITKAKWSHFVMPLNIVVEGERTGNSICIAIINSEGRSFTARMRNLNSCFQEKEQFRSLVILRDRQCKPLGAKGQEHLNEALNRGAVFIEAGIDEMTRINAVYETLVKIEEHALSVGQHVIDKRQFMEFIRNERVLGRSELFRHASRLCPPLAEALGICESESPGTAVRRDAEPAKMDAKAPKGKRNQSAKSGETADRAASRFGVDIVIGDDVIDSPHVGILGELKDGRRKLAISLTKPQCLVVLGYMGSGKSYALGVLIENALLAQPGLIEQTRPMSVVAFNFRKNPQSRFEHAGFATPNSKEPEIKQLAEKYGASPAAVKAVNVFGYKDELRRRASEYGPLTARPIQFKSNELGAEHWEILLKAPNREAEYMDIIRDIIQKLYYQERLTFRNLKRAIEDDERMSNTQRRRAMNRLDFAERWISDERDYEWSDVLGEGVLNIFDLRTQAMETSEALKLCLIVTDLVRRTNNGVNKMVVFDEAHEYLDCKELVEDLENAITQIRHDGLSFVVASQFPERIPERIFKYLLTRLIFKLPTLKSINYVRGAAPHLATLQPEEVANLGLEHGTCFVQTDDDCTNESMRRPQLLEVRPRCTMHGGSTVRQIKGDGKRNPELAGAR